MSEDETVKLVECLRAMGAALVTDRPYTARAANEAADAISSLQDELKRVNALLTASVDDYNTALEEVKRLREALTVTEALDHWLDTDPLIDVLGKLGRMSKTDFEKFRERGRAALTQ